MPEVLVNDVHNLLNGVLMLVIFRAMRELWEMFT